MSKGPWRAPTSSERALLFVLGEADIAERVALAEQLTSVSVRLSCGRGCGSLELRAASPVASLGESRRGLIVEAEGIDPCGRRALVGVMVVDGRVAALDISQFDTDGVAPPMPQTLRQLDAVPRGTLALNWMVPRARTILEEAGGRSA